MVREVLPCCVFAVALALGCGGPPARSNGAGASVSLEPRPNLGGPTDAAAAVPDVTRSEPKPAEQRPELVGGSKPQSDRLPAVPRLVAIGDVHGDRTAAVAALRLAGAIDAAERWVGGTLVVVQTGDQLDRGDDEREILELFERLAAEAKAAGGAFHVLNGNHELMNVLGDFRYVTPGGFDDFKELPGIALDQPPWTSWPAEHRGRAAAFFPGGPYAKRIAERPLVLVVGDTVFVHGGIRPEIAGEIDQLNRLSRSWLAGELEDPRPAIRRLMALDGPVWTRDFSEPEVTAAQCEELDRSLATLGVARMVVGHTVQPEGVTSACDGKVWRIDVGMARHYGGRPQALEIVGTQVRVLENHHGPGTAAPG